MMKEKELVEDKDTKKERAIEKKKDAIIGVTGLNIFITFAIAMLNKCSVETIITFLSYIYMLNCVIVIIIYIIYLLKKSS